MGVYSPVLWINTKSFKSRTIVILHNYGGFLEVREEGNMDHYAKDKTKVKTVETDV